jgi:WD40 repeat protein
LRVIASAVVATLLAGAALWTYRDDRMARLEELGREALMQGQPTHAAVYLAQAYQMGNQSRTLKIMLEQAMRSVDMLSTVHIDDADGYIGAMFSDDGTRLLGSSKTGQIVVWRADNGHTLLRFKADAGSSRTARFMPGGQHIAVLYTDGRVELRDARSGDPLRQGQVPPGYLPHSDPSPAHLAVYRKAKTAESAEQLMVFDLMRLQPVREITQTCAESLSPISPDGQSFYCLARGEGQTGVQVFSLGTAAKPYKLLDGTQVHRLALSLDGRTAVASTGDGELKAISLATHKLLRSVRDPAGGSPALAISEDGQWFAAGGETGTLLVWQIVSGKLTAVLPAGSNAIKEVHFLGGSSRLASLGYDGSLKLWNLQNSSLFSAAEPRQGYLVRSALTVNGERMATFADARGDLVGENMDAALKVWDLLAVGPLHHVGDARPMSQRTTVVPRRDAASRFESVTACDQRIRLDARADNSMLVTDLTGKRPVATLYDDTGSTSAIDCDSPLDWYVTGGANGDAILWSARTTQPILRFKGHSKNIANVRFLQDFGRFVTTGTDGTVLQWSFAQESRHPATVARRIACRIPLVLDGYTLKPQRIDRNACLSERIW